MSRPPEPIFLARQTYRRRRLEDAARFLPALGVLVMLVPVLWSSGASTRGGLIYVFSAWAVLIALVGPISARLSQNVRETDETMLSDEADAQNGDGGG